MVTLDELQKQITSIKKKNTQLEKRIKYLETKSGDTTETTNTEEDKDKAPQEEKKQDKPKKKYNFESDVGRKLFGYIGILALVIGVGFFVTTESGFSHLSRVIVGIIFGLIIVFAGEFVERKKKYTLWARILYGGGLAIIYFTIYAMYFLQSFKENIQISQITEIVLLSVVVISAIGISIQKNSRVIAYEAFLLGFVTSVLSKSMDIVMLIYVLILVLGIIFISIKKSWTDLSISGVIGVYLSYIFWFSENTDNFTISMSFLTVYFLSFLIQTMLYKKDTSTSENAQLTTGQILNGAFFFLFSVLLFEKHLEEYTGPFIVAIGLFYLILYLTSKKHLFLKNTNLALSLSYITLAIPIEANRELLTLFWSFEFLILAYLGNKYKITLLKVFSNILMGLTGLYILILSTYSFNKFDPHNFFESTYLINYMGFVLVLYLSSIIVQKFNKNEDGINTLSKLYTWIATTFGVIYFAVEFSEFLISISWILFAILLLIFGFALSARFIRIQGLILILITILKVFLYDVRSLSAAHKTISFLILGAILLLASFLYSKYKDKLKEIL